MFKKITLSVLLFTMMLGTTAYATVIEIGSGPANTGEFINIEYATVPGTTTIDNGSTIDFGDTTGNTTTETYEWDDDKFFMTDIHATLTGWGAGVSTVMFYTDVFSDCTVTGLTVNCVGDGKLSTGDQFVITGSNSTWSMVPSVTPVPLPATLFLFTSGLALLGIGRSRKEA